MNGLDLHDCGYLATFVGVLMEGEISLITSVLGAKMGYYNLYIAMVFAFIGSWIADWFKFILARYRGKKIIEKKIKLQKKIERATKLFDKNPYIVLSFYKLFFGATTIILILAGIKNIPIWRFAIHSFIATSIWLILLSSLAFYCGEALISNFKLFTQYSLEVLSVLSIIAIIYWLYIKRPFTKQCLEIPQ